MNNESKSIKIRESQLVKMVMLNLMTKKKVSFNVPLLQNMLLINLQIRR